MGKTTTIIVKSLAFSLVPALCSVLGSTSILSDWQVAGYIGPSVDVEYIKNIFSLASVILTFVLLTANLILHEMEEGKYKRQSQQLLKYNKDILVAALAEFLGTEYCNIDIRIFVPEKTLWWRARALFIKDMPLMFGIKNIKGLAEPGMTENLRFQVSPKENIQGLVGECYQSHKMVYDGNLKETNDIAYNLTDFQKSKTRDLKFITVCPLFNENKEVVAIVAFDCKHEITLNEQTKFFDTVLNYSQQLHEYVPELFKCKGGIFRCR